MLRQIAESSAAVRVANVFHAGTTRWCSSTTQRTPSDVTKDITSGILELCIVNGGSITGEHSIRRTRRFIP